MINTKHSKKISLAFTTYYSANYIIQQLNRDYFSLSENMIDEIIILDDDSEDYEILKSYTNNNIKIYKNESNLSPLLGRPILVDKCKNDWIFLMDSDNFLEKNVFIEIQKINLSDNTIYCPDFAKPNFSYKQFSNQLINLEFSKEKINELQIFLNTGNYLIPKKNYLEVSKKIDIEYSHFAVDVIYFNYLWLKSGFNLFCVKDFEYNHTIRRDSYYRKTCEKSSDKLKQINELFKK